MFMPADCQSLSGLSRGGIHHVGEVVTIVLKTLPGRAGVDHGGRRKQPVVPGVIHPSANLEPVASI